MNRGEKVFLLFYAAYTLVYLPCFFLVPQHFEQILPFHILGMFLGIPVLIIVFRNLYKRQFPNPNTKVTWAILMVLFAPSMIVYVCTHGIHPRANADGMASTRKLSWIGVSLLLLSVLMFAAGCLHAYYATLDQPVAFDAPPVLPVQLEIVYHEEDMLRGGNGVFYSGTATYTFRNERSFPVTLAFPPLCYYTYSRTRRIQFVTPIYSSNTQVTWQEQPFPDGDSSLPEFARQQRDIVIPAGESVAFTSPFNIGCTEGHPTLNHVFVLGMPRSPCSHPVLGTIYAKSIRITGTPKDHSHKNIHP